MPPLREIATDALRYWEPRRLAYNAILFAMVVLALTLAKSLSSQVLHPGKLVALFMEAVMANVLYCSAYVVDIFVQMSDFRDTWRNWRWVLFAIGTAFAAVIAYGMAGMLFVSHSGSAW